MIVSDYTSDIFGGTDIGLIIIILYLILILKKHKSFQIIDHFLIKYIKNVTLRL